MQVAVRTTDEDEAEHASLEAERVECLQGTLYVLSCFEHLLFASSNIRDGVMRRVTRSLPASYRHLATLSRTLVGPRIWANRHHVPTAIRLKVGGSGHVALTILKSTEASSDSPNEVLLVLPPGPALQSVLPQADILSDNKRRVYRLSEALPLTTIVTLNYRLSSSKHPYPHPIHDAATAFSYIANPGSPHNAGRAPTISLYGSHIGGSLALMLALTSPNLIQTLAVLEPFVDWEGLDERKSRAKDTQTQEAIAHLLSLRSRIFPNPQFYFDPFASPILFLRAPGRDTPASHSSSLTEDGDVLHPATNNDADAFGPYDDDPTSAFPNTPLKRRKVLRRWPPHGRPEDVTLPYVSFILRQGGGLNGVLREQGKEMADRMRKACFFGREEGFGEERIKTEILPEGKGVVDEAVLRLLGKVKG